MWNLLQNTDCPWRKKPAKRNTKVGTMGIHAQPMHAQKTRKIVSPSDMGQPWDDILHI